MKVPKLHSTVPVLALIFGLMPFAWGTSPAPRHAQASASSAAKAMSSSNAAAAAKGQSANVREGTKISARLTSTLDARKAKPGERVTARVTKNVKQHGHIVVHKGDRLIGHITKVNAGARSKAGSSVAVAFNQLVQGRSTMRLNAVLTSILSVPGRNQGGMESPEPMAPPIAAPESAPSGGGGGGLVGGVASTAGSTAGAAVGATGSTVEGASRTLGDVGGAVGATANSSLGANSGLGLSTPVRQVHLESQASADQSTGMNSVLSTRKGNLRLESGTRMRFRVEGSARAH